MQRQHPTTQQVRNLIEKIVTTEQTENSWLSPEFSDELQDLGLQVPVDKQIAFAFALGFECGRDYETTVQMNQQFG